MKDAGFTDEKIDIAGKAVKELIKKTAKEQKEGPINLVMPKIDTPVMPTPEAVEPGAPIVPPVTVQPEAAIPAEPVVDTTVKSTPAEAPKAAEVKTEVPKAEVKVPKKETKKTTKQEPVIDETESAWVDQNFKGHKGAALDAAKEAGFTGKIKFVQDVPKDRPVVS